MFLFMLPPIISLAILRRMVFASSFHSSEYRNFVFLERVCNHFFYSWAQRDDLL